MDMIEFVHKDDRPKPSIHAKIYAKNKGNVILVSNN